MGFSISDIIVLLVVLTILVVYRRMDQNNRSLEKVKRFVERIQGEMDEIVSEKVTMLRDIGIEVDVHQKAAVEVLKRIQTIESDLGSRTAALEEIGTRLTTYEAALEELMQMTRRAEENTQRVREESEYIDKVGKRIRATQTRVDELEKSLPGIVSGFDKQNMHRLAEAEARVLDNSRGTVAALDQKVEGARSRVQDLSEDAVRIQTELEQRARQAAQEIQELNDSLRVSFAEEMEGTIAATRDSYESVRDQITRQIEQARGQYAELQTEITEGQQRLQDELQRLLEDTRGEMEAIAAQASNLESDALAVVRRRIEDRGAALKEEMTALHEEYRNGQRELLNTRQQEVHQSIAAAIQQLRDDLEQQISEGHDRSLQQLSESNEASSAVALTVQSQAEKLRLASLQLEEQLQQLREHVARSTEEQSATIDRSIQETSERMQIFGDDLTGRMDRLNGDTQERLELLSARVSEVSGEFTRKTETLQQQVAHRLETLESGNRSQIDAFSERIQEAARELQSSMEGRIRTLEELGQQMTGHFADIEQQLAGARETAETRIRDFVMATKRMIDENSQTIEQDVLGRIEGRLADYEDGLGYRFSRIEGVTGEIDDLEQNLRTAMDRINERIRGDFTAFGDELRAQREEDRSVATAAMNNLQGEMQKLEGELNELKERAYDNVSEKLRVFEDEFFLDLRNRSAAMDARIAGWREEVDGRLETLQRDSEEGRIQLEREYGDQLKERMHQFQEHAQAQLMKMDEQLDSHRSGLSGRIESAEATLASFQNGIQEELNALQSRSLQMFRQEFSQVEDRVRTDLKGFEEELDTQLTSIRQHVTVENDALSSLIEVARSDVAVWQTRVLNEIRSSDAEVSNQLADTKVRMSENLQELKREFAQERDELVEQSREERGTIKSELEKIRTEMVRLHTHLDEHRQEDLNELQRKYTTVQQQLASQETAIQEELDERTREFRALLGDTREQFSAMQEKLLGKLEEEASTLGTTLHEIERRQKGFIEQTGIFERADTLKEQLTQDIEELKGEISRFEAMRGEVREIEAEFGRVRKLAADAGEKMARFTADKRRIDLLEEDYRRLMTLAQSVEKKIEHVGGSEEQLQEITARLRSLDELQKAVENRFDRLEKRRSQVDQAVEDIDSSTETLHQLEEQLQQFKQGIHEFPEALQHLSQQLKAVMSQEKATEKAIGALSSLDDTLSDVERRMSELATAREWLARTETRLEEISRDAGEQVKLLGSIMRQETKKGASDSAGAPSMNARETVQKLARQGWKVDEIARATKISKGEVELILELSGK